MAGLARRVHDSATLHEKFADLVKGDTTLTRNRRALSRRVPTRWNSDLECLLSHVYFRNVVEQLTAVSSNGLQAYRLTVEQWGMVDDIKEILLVYFQLLSVEICNLFCSAF